MNNKEFRIGNLVHDANSGELMTVTELDIAAVGASLDSYDKMMNLKERCDMQPLPITPALLFRFGFMRQPEGNVFRLKHILVFSTNDDDVYEFASHYFRLKKILYAHELQNLYFALTDEELEYV